MTAILKDQPPPVSSLRPLAPASLDRVVKKCLEKDPQRRERDIGNARRDLDLGDFDELAFAGSAPRLRRSEI